MVVCYHSDATLYSQVLLMLPVVILCVSALLVTSGCGLGFAAASYRSMTPVLHRHPHPIRMNIMATCVSFMALPHSLLPSPPSLLLLPPCAYVSVCGCVSVCRCVRV